MNISPAGMKFLFAFSLPALFVLLSIVGGDRWDGYWLFASLLTVAGGICMAGAVGRSANRYVSGIFYVVALELMLLVLP